MVAEDRELVPKVIEEVLRYEAPSPVQARYVTRDVEWYGPSVPRATSMLMLNGAANRDDRKFDTATPSTSTARSTTTSASASGCTSASAPRLARLEGRVALDEVLKRWPYWEVDHDDAIQARTSTVRGWTRLPVHAGEG